MKMVDDDAKAAIRSVRAAIGRRGLRGDDLEEVAGKVLLRALETLPEGVSLKDWAKGCVPNVLREHRRRGAKETPSDTTEEIARGSAFGGARKEANAPAGYGRLLSGGREIMPLYDEVNEVVRAGGAVAGPVRKMTDADAEAAIGVHSLIDAFVRTVEDGTETEARRTMQAPAVMWDRIHTAYQAAYGYSASDAPWVRGAGDIAHVVERVMLDELDGKLTASPAQTTIERLQEQDMLPGWLKPSDLDEAFRRAELSIGGRGKKGTTGIEKAVRRLVNAARRSAGLDPLPVSAEFFSPRKTRSK